MPDAQVYHVQPSLLREGQVAEQEDLRFEAVDVVLLADYDALLRSSTDQTILFGLAVHHLDEAAHARFMAEPQVQELLERAEVETNG